MQADSGPLATSKPPTLVGDAGWVGLPVCQGLGIKGFERDAAYADCVSGSTFSVWRVRNFLTLIFLANDVFEFGLVFGGPAGTRLGGEHTRRLGLADAFAGVGLDGLGGGKRGWLAFRHGKDEYGRD